ncbi:MAG: ABC transporter ATP-binding protein [Pseudomonadales bacterium]
MRLEDLSFRYPGAAEETLASLSLHVSRGEAHALLGSSGAGKSTLLNLLSGLLPAPSGCVFFDDADVGALPPWPRRVTQVFQFPVLYDSMTVAENLAFPMRDLPAAEQRQRLGEIAERLSVAALLDARPAALTLVEKQLVAIGRALTRPDVSLVLLDEPLTAAEPAHKWRLRQTLKAVQRDLGATMIYVTHDQTEALTFADRVSVLHGGRILQTATPRELLEAPAHEHVGYFVGSPGMNLLDAEIRQRELLLGGHRLGRREAANGPCRIGFRPEWATLTSGGGGDGLPVRITGMRTLGAERDHLTGLVMADLGGAAVITRQVLDGVSTGAGRLRLPAERLICFRDGWRLDELHKGSENEDG